MEIETNRIVLMDFVNKKAMAQVPIKLQAKFNHAA